MYNRFNTYLLALFLSVFAFIGCKSDDLIEGPDQLSTTLVLRLGLSVPSGDTRGAGDTNNPTGGEQGDGWRVGQCNENNVYDVYLYQYSSADGINAADETPVKLLAYQKDVNFKPSASAAASDGKITTEIKFNVGNYVWQAAGNDHFIACINTENLGESTTLGKLRNELIAYTCRQTGSQMKDYDRFTMANAHDSQYKGGDGTEAYPYLVEIDVERTAARIDFAYSLSDANFKIQDGKYVYNVIGESDDEVHLTHVRATNVMQGASYLIKRLAANSTEAPEYLATETDPASKYVVEPTTWTKTIQAATDKTLNLNSLFLDSWYMNAHEAYNTSWFRNQDKVHCGSGDAFTDGTTKDEVDNWRYYVLDYANENTMLADQTLHHYTTGLVLKATYKPEKIYADASLTEDNSYAIGSTFWRWHDIDTNKDLFFSNEAAANAYMTGHPHSVVFPYENAQCYYNVWLRHENIVDDPNTTMMEFGIVRNNIYRVCVEFTGIGMPDVPDDMTTPESIRMYIFVRKWNLVEHPKIEI